jgi:hypothetical protein
MLNMLLEQDPKFGQDKPCIAIICVFGKLTQMPNFVFQAA